MSEISASTETLLRPDELPPAAVGGPWTRIKAKLFSSWWSTATTLLLGYLTLRWGFAFLAWSFGYAVWSVPYSPQGTPDTAACHAVKGIGACWAVIADKYRLILFGRFPFAEQWRPAICIALFIGLYVISAMRRFWRKELVLIWIATLTVIGILMWGGVFGLTYVRQDIWGGLPLTLILSTFGVALAFPLAILVALGRRATNLPAVKLLCVLYVELIRGVPLISVLFMASVMFPLFLPEGIDIDKVLRAQLGIVLFSAAYLAETIRGGLQAMPREQYEAADALGLGYWRKTLLVILPQALRLVIPPLVNSFIGLFKDTSLVLIVGIFDLLNTAKVAMSDPVWQPFSTEVYLFLAAIYFSFCCAMTQYSRRLERDFDRGRR